MWVVHGQFLWHSFLPVGILQHHCLHPYRFQRQTYKTHNVPMGIASVLHTSQLGCRFGHILLTNLLQGVNAKDRTHMKTEVVFRRLSYILCLKHCSAGPMSFTTFAADTTLLLADSAPSPRRVILRGNWFERRIAYLLGPYTPKKYTHKVLLSIALRRQGAYAEQRPLQRYWHLRACVGGRTRMRAHTHTHEHLRFREEACATFSPLIRRGKNHDLPW